MAEREGFRRLNTSLRPSAMTSYHKVCSAIFSASPLTVLSCIPGLAQGPEELTVANVPVTDAAPAPQMAATPDTDPPPPPPPPVAISSDNWRVAVSVYGWFAGEHGTVGAVSPRRWHPCPIQRFASFLKGLIPIAVEADKGRIVMPIDFLWIKVGDDRAVDRQLGVFHKRSSPWKTGAELS